MYPASPKKCNVQSKNNAKQCLYSSNFWMIYVCFNTSLYATILFFWPLIKNCDELNSINRGLKTIKVCQRKALKSYRTRSETIQFHQYYQVPVQKPIKDCFRNIYFANLQSNSLIKLILRRNTKLIVFLILVCWG